MIDWHRADKASENSGKWKLNHKIKSNQRKEEEALKKKSYYFVLKRYNCKFLNTVIDWCFRQSRFPTITWDEIWFKIALNRLFFWTFTKWEAKLITWHPTLFAINIRFQQNQLINDKVHPFHTLFPFVTKKTPMHGKIKHLQWNANATIRTKSKQYLVTNARMNVKHKKYWRCYRNHRKIVCMAQWLCPDGIHVHVDIFVSVVYHCDISYLNTIHFNGVSMNAWHD